MNNNPQGGAAGGQDYGDKAFGAVAKKFGGAQGQKVANNRAMSEKVVRLALSHQHDFARNHNKAMSQSPCRICAS